MSGSPTPLQVFLLELDPIVGCHVETGSPCGDPMGVEHRAMPVRLSDVVSNARRLPYYRTELDRLGWNLQ